MNKIHTLVFIGCLMGTGVTPAMQRRNSGLTLALVQFNELLQEYYPGLTAELNENNEFVVRDGDEVVDTYATLGDAQEAFPAQEMSDGHFSDDEEVHEQALREKEELEEKREAQRLAKAQLEREELERQRLAAEKVARMKEEAAAFAVAAALAKHRLAEERAVCAQENAVAPAAASTSTDEEVLSIVRALNSEESFDAGFITQQAFAGNLRAVVMSDKTVRVLTGFDEVVQIYDCPEQARAQVAEQLQMQQAEKAEYEAREKARIIREEELAAGKEVRRRYVLSFTDKEIGFSGETVARKRPQEAWMAALQEPQTICSSESHLNAFCRGYINEEELRKGYVFLRIPSCVVVIDKDGREVRRSSYDAAITAAENALIASAHAATEDAAPAATSSQP